MVEVIAKIAEVAAKGIEKLSGSVAEIKNRVSVLDKPLNVEDVEALKKGTNPTNLLDTLDKPLKEAVDISNVLEYDERGFRGLTESERQELKENTKWSDKSIELCRINEDGVIQYPCRNEKLAGTTHPLTGVKYERRIEEYYGYQVEVVRPEFESVFELSLPPNLIEATDRNQFKECNKKLYEAIQGDSRFAKKFTPEQIEQIKDGRTNGGAPDGYTWHHDLEIGKMQLVDSDIHGDTGHTGGKPLWGGGNENR